MGLKRNEDFFVKVQETKGDILSKATKKLSVKEQQKLQLKSQKDSKDYLVYFAIKFNSAILDDVA